MGSSSTKECATPEECAKESEFYRRQIDRGLYSLSVAADIVKQLMVRDREDPAAMQELRNLQVRLQQQNRDLETCRMQMTTLQSTSQELNQSRQHIEQLSQQITELNHRLGNQKQRESLVTDLQQSYQHELASLKNALDQAKIDLLKSQQQQKDVLNRCSNLDALWAEVAAMPEDQVPAAINERLSGCPNQRSALDWWKDRQQLAQLQKNASARSQTAEQMIVQAQVSAAEAKRLGDESATAISQARQMQGTVSSLQAQLASERQRTDKCTNLRQIYAALDERLGNSDVDPQQAVQQVLEGCPKEEIDFILERYRRRNQRRKTKADHEALMRKCTNFARISEIKHSAELGKALEGCPKEELDFWLAKLSGTEGPPLTAALGAAISAQRRGPPAPPPQVPETSSGAASATQPPKPAQRRGTPAPPPQAPETPPGTTEQKRQNGEQKGKKTPAGKESWMESIRKGVKLRPVMKQKRQNGEQKGKKTPAGKESWMESIRKGVKLRPVIKQTRQKSEQKDKNKQPSLVDQFIKKIADRRKSITGEEDEDEDDDKWKE
ncbi:MAG: hypothetical protein ACYCOU_01555 [Sulfobacillus sp.]